VKAIVLRQWRSAAIQQAQELGLEVAGVDWLLREMAGVDRLQLHLAQPQADLRLSCPLETIAAFWQRHCEQGEPLQYVLGVTTWRNLRLQVGPAVLIPRPETELVVDLALELLQEEPSLATGEWVDLGTGSGAIPIALALEVPAHYGALKLHGVDRSPEALTIAQENARRQGLTSLQWHLGSWFEPFVLWHGQDKISVMLSNPPYIPTEEVEALSPTVRDYEPRLALEGGPDGLEAIDHLIHTAPHYLRPGGVWLVEVMAGQAPIVRDKLEATGHYDRVTLHPDLDGIHRFVLARTLTSAR
jgi:release factor glutamine methyltransferase